MVIPLALVVAAALATQQPGPRGTLVVLNKGEGTASLIDLGTGRTVARLPTGEGPHEVVVSRDGRTAVAANYGTGPAPGSSLTVMDVPGRRVLRTIDMGAALRPHGLVFLPGDSLVAVTSETMQLVSVVRVSDGTVVRTAATRARGSHMVTVAADGRRAWTGNIPEGTISEVDLLTGAHLRFFPVPPQPEALTATADGGQVWVGSNSQGLVSVVDTRTGRVDTAATGLGWPYRILFTPEGRTALLPDYRGEQLRVLDAVTRAERGRLSFAGGGPQGIAVSPDGRWAFQSLATSGEVAIIDLTRLEVVRRIGTGAGPDGVGYSAVETGP